MSNRNINDYKYLIELHAHTMPVSPCGQVSPEGLVKEYLEKGFSAVVITNHFYRGNIYNRFTDAEDAADFYYGDYLATKKAAEGTGLKIIFGMEAVFLKSSGEHLLYGVNRDDIIKVFDHRNGTVTEYLNDMGDSRPLVIEAHPTRGGINFSPEGPFDGLEAYNLHLPADPEAAVEYGRKHDLIITGSSDYHDPGYAGIASIMSKNVPSDSYEVAALLKSRDFFVQSGDIIFDPIKKEIVNQ